MTPEPFSARLRAALEPDEREVVELRAAALRPPGGSRRSRRGVAIAVAVAASVAVAWLAIRPVLRNGPRHTPAPAATLTNEGGVVRLRTPGETWLVGTADESTRSGAARRVWISTSSSHLEEIAHGNPDR